MIGIRQQQPGDAPDVRHVNELAFGQALEADLVERLQEACPDWLSLVAEDDGHIVGHILFTPVVVAGKRRVTGMGLGPMAILPDRQRAGIGSRLVREGLAILRARGCPFVVVIGHPEYYPRFGFERASAHGLSSQWEGIPDDAFMMVILATDTMLGVTGVATYRREFDDAAADPPG